MKRAVGLMMVCAILFGTSQLTYAKMEKGSSAKGSEMKGSGAKGSEMKGSGMKGSGSKDKAMSVTAAILLTKDDKMIPETIYVMPDTELTLLVYNARKSNGKFRAPGSTEPVEIKPKKMETIKVSGLTEGENTCQFTCKKSNFEGASKIIVGKPGAAESRDIVILGVRLKFLPQVSMLCENQPTNLLLYSTIGMPHSNFELFGTGIKLPFKKGKLQTVALDKGLKQGTYLISRPKYPKQNHKIASRLEVMARPDKEK